MVDDEVLHAAPGDLLRRADVQFLERAAQPVVAGLVFHRVGIGVANCLVGVCGHRLQGFGRGPDVGVYTVGMPVVVSVVAVRAGACDQVDTAAQVHDFRLIPDFAQQGGFEVDQSHVENELCLVQLHELPGRRLERLGTCSGRHEHLYFEIVADNPLHDAAQRGDRDVKRIFPGGLFRRAGREQQGCQ